MLRRWRDLLGFDQPPPVVDGATAYAHRAGGYAGPSSPPNAPEEATTAAGEAPGVVRLCADLGDDRD